MVAKPAGRLGRVLRTLALGLAVGLLAAGAVLFKGHIRPWLDIRVFPGLESVGIVVGSDEYRTLRRLERSVRGVDVVLIEHLRAEQFNVLVVAVELNPRDAPEGGFGQAGEITSRLVLPLLRQDETFYAILVSAEPFHNVFMINLCQVQWQGKQYTVADCQRNNTPVSFREDDPAMVWGRGPARTTEQRWHSEAFYSE